ncbi:MAG: helix-turn-helix transcriptional regulator [Lachnospiraceae bacterium]|nr:helix-turn-helix transcriptional regulator [Lachnospiraceae bacterium]
MNNLKIADNLVALRREKGVTQEVVADFLGVSKASVSKWEKGVSLPDVAQIPRLASYYDITIDELMGYQAWLSVEQIREYYNRFAEDFSKHKFVEVIEDVRDFIRRYYACCPALLQIVILLLNHYTMAKIEDQPKILEEMIHLCEHIQEKSEDVNICTEANIYQASIELIRGNPQAAIEKLQPYQDLQRRKDGAELMLVQAYQMTGQMEKATEWNQVNIFANLLSMVGNSTFYIMSNLSDKKVALTTIERTQKLVDAYELDKLHPNSYLQFIYTKALFYATNGMEQAALENLTVFVDGAIDFILNAAYLHGDEYFDRLDNHLKKMDNYNMLPRNPKTVLASIGENLQHPAFAGLHDKPEFQALVNRKELNFNK